MMKSKCLLLLVTVLLWMLSPIIRRHNLNLIPNIRFIWRLSRLRKMQSPFMRSQASRGLALRRRLLQRLLLLFLEMLTEDFKLELQRMTETLLLKALSTQPLQRLANRLVLLAPPVRKVPLVLLARRAPTGRALPMARF